MSEDRPYPNTGKLYAALEDFKLGYCAGMTKSWPRYWKEFADQAFADLIAMEVEKSELNAQLAEARELAEFYGNRENYYARSVKLSCGCCSVVLDCRVDEDEGNKARAFLAKYFPSDTGKPIT